MCEHVRSSCCQTVEGCFASLLLFFFFSLSFLQINRNKESNRVFSCRCVSSAENLYYNVPTTPNHQTSNRPQGLLCHSFQPSMLESNECNRGFRESLQFSVGSSERVFLVLMEKGEVLTYKGPEN